MSILDVYNYALWLFSVINDNYRYFEDRVNQVFDKITGIFNKAVEYIDKQIWKLITEFTDKLNAYKDKLVEYILKQIGNLQDWAQGRIDKVFDYAAKQFNSLKTELTNYAYGLYKLALQAAKDFYGLAHQEIQWVSQIGAAWGFDFNALGSYLGYLGNWLDRQRIDRLVLFDSRALDYLLAVASNPVGFFTSLLKANLLAVLQWLLAEGLRNENDVVPPFPFPTFKV